MKLGRNLPKVRAALVATGLLERAVYVERGHRWRAKSSCRWSEKPDDVAPYFAIVLVPGRGASPVTGEIAIVGLWPGPAAWLTPEANEALAGGRPTSWATSPMWARVPDRPGLARHASDNRVERDRARHAFALALEGRRVAVVSGGDPGIFAMAAAIFETLDVEPAYRAVPVRVGAGPFGHAGRGGQARRTARPRFLRALAVRQSEALACRPAAPRGCGRGRLRRRDLQSGLCRRGLRSSPTPSTMLRAGKSAATPVAFARAIGRPEEGLHLTTLGEADAALADMSTLVIVGSSETRLVEGQGGRRWMLTPRSYGGATHLPLEGPPR